MPIFVLEKLWKIRTAPRRPLKDPDEISAQKWFNISATVTVVFDMVAGVRLALTGRVGGFFTSEPSCTIRHIDRYNQLSGPGVDYA